jgi:hypothetical protein
MRFISEKGISTENKSKKAIPDSMNKRTSCFCQFSGVKSEYFSEFPVLE